MPNVLYPAKYHFHPNGQYRGISISLSIAPYARPLVVVNASISVCADSCHFRAVHTMYTTTYKYMYMSV